MSISDRSASSRSRVISRSLPSAARAPRSTRDPSLAGACLSLSLARGSPPVASEAGGPQSLRSSVTYGRRAAWVRPWSSQALLPDALASPCLSQALRLRSDRRQARRRRPRGQVGWLGIGSCRLSSKARRAGVFSGPPRVVDPPELGQLESRSETSGGPSGGPDGRRHRTICLRQNLPLALARCLAKD